MGQTLIIEADNESDLSESDVAHLKAILDSVNQAGISFDKFRLEIQSDTALSIAQAGSQLAGVREYEKLETVGGGADGDQEETEPMDESQPDVIADEYGVDDSEGEQEEEAESTDNDFPDVDLEEMSEMERARYENRQSDELPTMNPGTRKFGIAATLYRSDDEMTVSEIVEASAGTEWEGDQSSVSASLYDMFRQWLVHRDSRGENGPYEYWLTEDGIAAIEAYSDDEIDETAEIEHSAD